MIETKDNPTNSSTTGKFKVNSTIIQYIVFVMFFTFVIGVFSIIMSSIASYRNDIYYSTIDQTELLYNGPIEQSAPSLGGVSKDSDLYFENNLSIAKINRYIENTTLQSTNAEVLITADFVKKGLTYQPTYQTKFGATYVLKNELDEESIISFDFPFPVDTTSQEISNAKLVVNGEEIPNAKSTITTNRPNENYDYPYPDNKIDGLSWEGKIPAGEEAVVEVSYDTVGLSTFSYQGIENPKGAQDFNFKVTILGTRNYDVLEGLSVTERNFGDNSVELIWNKPDLYSSPEVRVAVGDKVNPSTQVSRVYLTMAPVYVVFMTILIYLAYRFGKNKLGLFDVFLVSLLFIAYFPFVHYLSSFTIDPTIDIFSSFANVPSFSMPLIGAFLLAGILIGGLIYYLLGRIAGFSFSTKFAIPAIILFLGFFPFVVTIPEYSMLLVIIGAIALMAIIVQARVKTVNV